jgi:[glutamine synthetase] adenylyltransferase / [glutamine synthetase]-adenylyl-L-tyrosine phosphorylase
LLAEKANAQNGNTADPGCHNRAMPALIDDPRSQAIAQRALARLRAASPEYAHALDETTPEGRRYSTACAAVAIVSDLAIDTLLRQPGLFATLCADDGARPLPLPELAPETQSDWPTLLRRYRYAESTRLIWRDVQGVDTLDDTLAGTTRLADTCLQLALEALESIFAERFGVVRDEKDRPVRLVVFALGKLGGGELNFSSDIDLVYAYTQDGESSGDDGGADDTRARGRRGVRSLAAEDYFARLGQQLAKLLDEVTAEGFCHRVDLRLRPFGRAGRLALSFHAMEQYFQREGRDWERYAWQKARAVAGDVEAGERFLQTLRPFVYRRYLDYGALDGLREMKATIAAEVARKDMADDIKRGPGGIREIEFLAQALQLIRGGREPALRERRLQPALRALRDARHLTDETAARLTAAYRFLRMLENRLQMLRDAQTQRLPDDAVDRIRIAHGLGFRQWGTLEDALRAHREAVTREFEALLAVSRRNTAPEAPVVYWRGLREADVVPANAQPVDASDASDAQVLAAMGFDRPDETDRVLRDFARSPGVRDASDATRARLDRLMPVLLAGVAVSAAPSLALRRALTMLQAILRRASYLALLDEQPAALARLTDVLARSALLGERLAAHPLLLDELLDARAVGPLPQREDCEAAARSALQDDDSEASLFALNEARQALSFRIGLAALDRRQPAEDSARQLAWVADAIVRAVYMLALRELHTQHGLLPGGQFAVLGYGSLGGQELGFGSDLDLVFLYDAPSDAVSTGMRPLDAARWNARLAQKIVALLGTPTGAGHLYDIDVRLRPDGAKGLLVSTLASFEDYQRHRAWTWEHQALVRARAIVGDASLCAEFERVRAEILSRPRDSKALREDIANMRARMRAELDRSDDMRFDLKQGEGGLVDLEFLLQFLVLREAHAHHALLSPRDTLSLLRFLGESGLLNRSVAIELVAAHAALLEIGLGCTLDGRARMVALSEVDGRARATISRAVSGRFLDGAL